MLCGQTLTAGGTRPIPHRGDAHIGAVKHAIMMGENGGGKNAPKTRDLVFPFSLRQSPAQGTLTRFEHTKPAQGGRDLGWC
jgi:hypothetical protein